MTQNLIAQGAEAKIILSNDFIIKDRISKSYRIPELDKKIRARRTKSEAKLLEKASEIINCPKPFLQPLIKKSTKLKMPFINGEKLSEHLDNFSLKKQKEICKQIGKDVAKLHDSNIIHGDLTTSNMILVSSSTKTLPLKKDYSLTKSQRSSPTKSGTGQPISERSEPIIYFIDFGLGFISHKFEDKAVDVHLLKQALEAKHFKNWKILFSEFEKGYKKSKDAEKTLNQLNKVEKRGRYKS